MSGLLKHFDWHITKDEDGVLNFEHITIDDEGYQTPQILSLKDLNFLPLGKLHRLRAQFRHSNYDLVIYTHVIASSIKTK